MSFGSKPRGPQACAARRPPEKVILPSAAPALRPEAAAPVAAAGRPMTIRSHLLALAALIALLAPAAAAAAPWHNDDVTGAMPDLAFSLTEASDGRTVSAADLRGKVTLLYFGYTFCPDVCPTTLANMASVLQRLGKQADQVRLLFVTVDPNRDTLPVLKDYVADFGPEVEGLRGTPDALARLARRYHVTYSVTPSPDPTKYQVTHSSAILVFDRQGRVRLLITSMASAAPDIAGTAADLRRLIDGDGGGLAGWLAGLF